jgi:diacylglycerol kinase
MKRWLRENPRHALRGLAGVLRTETSGRIQAFAAIVIIGVGFFFGIDRAEWIAIIFAIALVIGAECFNTAVESLADAVHPERHSLIGKAKDCAAGGVLVAAIAAAVIGFIVFAPKVISWLQTLLQTSTSPAN